MSRIPVFDIRVPFEPARPRLALPQARHAETLVPLVLLALASIVLIALGGDRWIADRIYAAEGGHWALRGSHVLTRVIHSGGKALSFLAWFGVAAMAIRSTMHAPWRPLRRPLVVLVLSVGASTLLVSLLKHATQMDCPWDAAIYGGTHPYFTLLQPRPAGIRPSGCFPAGQASAGYAWVALYFFFASARPAWRRIGLAIGIGAGLVLGIAQQLRGAHYLSHDVWTLAICWFVALGLHRWSLRRAPTQSAATVRFDSTAIEGSPSR